jgi:hypothetical protein
MITFHTSLVAVAIVLLLLVLVVKRRARTSGKAARPPRPNQPLAHSARAGAVGSGLEWEFAESFDQNDSDGAQAACAESTKIGGDDAGDPACSALDDIEEGDNRCEDGGSGDTGSDTDCGSGNTD